MRLKHFVLHFGIHRQYDFEPTSYMGSHLMIYMGIYRCMFVSEKYTYMIHIHTHNTFLCHLSLLPCFHPNVTIKFFSFLLSSCVKSIRLAYMRWQCTLTLLFFLLLSPRSLQVGIRSTWHDILGRSRLSSR